MTSATRRGTAAVERRAAAAPEDWPTTNQRFLAAALSRLGAALERHAAQSAGAGARLPAGPLPAAEQPAQRDTPDGRAPALEQLRSDFLLTGFECDLLLLCAAVELDARFPALCAAAQGDPQRPYVTFSLALAALPGAHWSALSPLRPLRRWHLVEAGPGPSLTLNPLRIDERVLHYLAGVPGADPRLACLLQPPRPASEPVPSQQALAARIGAAWARAGRAGDLPLVQLCGEQGATSAVAGAVCAALGLTLSVLPAALVPTGPGEIETLARLWEREAVLTAGALLVDCYALEETDSARAGAIVQLLERTAGRLLVSSPERRLAGGRAAGQRPRLTFEVHNPGPDEQRVTWQRALAGRAAALNGHIDLLVSQFDLSLDVIHAATVEALGQIEAPPQEAGPLAHALWDACRAQARPRLDDLAQRIEPRATWDDLVLPEAQRQVLRDIAVHVRQRATVYERWGFGARGGRGLGIAALFAGPSGTGKTLAAEVLAGALRLDLYRIDLSAVVSKYIGETEKNLRRVFDAAEAGGAVLLFDEADALFGKRSEVKDAHDRYANIEVGYLLQRMEAYRGLAVLTTNAKSALDPAFLRRLRFVVQFPFPDASQRALIWSRVFPQATPVQGVDTAALARLSVAGGTIRNIALGAAFAAADAGEPVQMSHLLRAAQAEYAKLERTLTEAEVAGWEGLGAGAGAGAGVEERLMLPEIHGSLERLLFERGRIPSREVDVRFEVPTQEWIDGLTRPTISFYLFDLRENTTLRRTNVETTRENGRATKRLPPRRFDLNYLVSAITTNEDDGHRLLWRTLGVLLRYQRLPAEVLDEQLRELDPPVACRVLSADEAVRPLDVWSALGTAPRPAVTYAVAAPLDLELEFEVPLVLTGTTRVRPIMAGAGDDADTHIYVGGVVRDGAGAPLEGVTVSLDGTALTSVTGPQGTFALSGVPSGTVTLRASRPGRPERSLTLEVPAGSYDIVLD